jgi:hypothetical protein
VAQLVAHLLWEQGVARSNRVAPTMDKDEIGKMKDEGVAPQLQLGEIRWEMGYGMSKN